MIPSWVFLFFDLLRESIIVSLIARQAMDRDNARLTLDNSFGTEIKRASTRRVEL
jgi:hypothetical protein